MKAIFLILLYSGLTVVQSTWAFGQEAQDLPADSFEVSLLDPDLLATEIESKIEQHDYHSAISSILSAIEFYKHDNDLEKVYYYRFVLSRLYFYIGLTQKALNTLEYCHVYFKQEGRDLDVVRSQHALAYIYKKIGNPDMAIYFLGQCENNKADEFNAFCKHEHMLIDAFLFLNKQTSPDVMQQVYQYAKSISNADLQLKSLEVLGEYYFQLAQYNLAEGVFNKALDLSRELKYFDYGKQFAYRLYECHHFQENHQAASDHLLEFIEFNDTLNQIKNSESLLRLIGKYEQKELQTEKIDLEKSKRLFELKSRRSNFTLYSLLFSIGAILLAGYFVILFYQQKLETSNIIHNQSEQINNQKIKELESNLQLRSMQSMIDGQESERERIAQDLHDSLGGLLSTIKLRFDKLVHQQKFQDQGDFTKLYDLIDTACDEVRSISNDLKPGALEKLGLIDAVKDLLNRYRLENGPNIIFQYFGFDQPVHMDPHMALNLYRIIQELVNNSIKHAQCSEIFVQLSKSEVEYTISVEDDGLGFDIQEVKKGMGLENISSRVNYLKGEFTVESSENQGTLFLIQIPIG
ncbi:MAG TPA: sensor histidine kinase [Saprospiraceae bacterium]|nr:sensor histidine kinase [Saprospiraceae bacterium]